MTTLSGPASPSTFQSSRYLAALLTEATEDKRVGENSREPFYVQMREEIGARVRVARKRQGLSQRDLAVLANVRESTIADWERGKTPWERIAELARLLDVTPEWLFRGVVPVEEQVSEMRAQLERLEALIASLTRAGRGEARGL